MNSYHIVICDDNKAFADDMHRILSELFERHQIPVQINIFFDSLRLQEQLENHMHSDIYFLDIDMPNVNGLTLAHLLRTYDRDAVILFVSNKEEFVFDTFEVQPFAFVRKYKMDALYQVVPRLINQLQKTATPPKIVLKTAGRSIRLAPADILYAEAVDKQIRIVFVEGELVLRFPLSRLEDVLKDHGFLRIHKGYLVNFKSIFSIESNHVVLDNGTKLPVSKHRLKDIKESFRRLLHEY